MRVDPNKQNFQKKQKNKIAHDLEKFELQLKLNKINELKETTMLS